MTESAGEGLLGNSRDPLLKMRVYSLACELVDEAWPDVQELKTDVATEKISGQLYKAIGSIASNIAEGYGHSSGRDRARMFEYALGSARESMAWYRTAYPVLGKEKIQPKLEKLEEIRRMLIAIIPRERGRLIRPGAK